MKPYPIQLAKIISVSLLFSTTLFTFLSAKADTSVDNLIGGYGQNTQKSLMTAPPFDAATNSIPEGIAQNIYLPYPMNPSAISQTLQSLGGYLIVNPNAKVGSAKYLNNVTNNIVTFGPGSSTVGGNTVLSGSFLELACSASSSICQQQMLQPFTNVDLNSLLGPLTYQSSQAQTAQNYIQSVSGISIPLPLVDLNKLAANSNPATTAADLATNNPDVAQYINDLRVYSALEDTGLSNLNQLYAERLPNSASSQSGIPNALETINIPNASALQAENYMATRRIVNPTWISGLSNDTSAALLRQIAILLAENLAESYNTRMSIERLTATMSVMELEQAGTAKSVVAQDITNLNNQNSNSGGSGS